MPSGGFAGTTRIIAVVALSLSAFTLAHSQTNRLLMTEEYVPRYFTKEHGLPDNQVQAILQTRDGYLWIATRAGLARFNGQKFTVFNRPNTPELANDDCRTLIEDTNGKLVVRASYDWYYHTGLQSPAFEKMTDVRAGTVWTLCSSRVGWLWAAKVNSLSRVQEGRIIESYTSNAWGGD